MLAKNIQKFDIINILSSEPQRVPDSVLKYLQNNKATSKLKVIKTGKSLEDYARYVEQISSKLDKEHSLYLKTANNNRTKFSEPEKIEGYKNYISFKLRLYYLIKKLNVNTYL